MERGRRIVIGVVGNLGSGKTTLCQLLRRRGCRYISADRIGREVLPKIAESLVRRFGTDIVRRGRIDRSRLAARAFADAGSYAFLNRLSHPLLTRELRQRLCRIKTGTVILDGALLLDWPTVARLIDIPILVTAPRALRRKRALAAGMDARTVTKIMKRQTPERLLARKARYVVRNAGTREGLEKAAVRLWEEIEHDN